MALLRRSASNALINAKALSFSRPSGTNRLTLERVRSPAAPPGRLGAIVA
jgi:hypothetical protein